MNDNIEKIDYWLKWCDLKADNLDFIVDDADYANYVNQGGSINGSGILAKNILQEKLDKLAKRRARIFNIIQQADFITEHYIKQILESKKSIDKFAYIKHDKDFNVDGTIKKAHFHIIIATKQSTPLSILSVAKWLKVPMNLVDIPKGKNAFIQCVQYLTHETDKEQKAGKHKYDDNEIKANFDFRELIEEYKNNSKNPDVKADWRARVFNGLDLSEVPENIYLADRTELNSIRKEYVKNKAPIPFLRTNIFIEGLSGVGKTLAAREYANSLCGYILTPENYDKMVFEAGGKGVVLQGYTGQKIIIWDDVRSVDIVEFLGGMAGFLNTFDPIPSRSEQGIKYGSIRLVNNVNIITGKENFEEFINNLLSFEIAKDAEADKQLIRRFPIIASINKFNYDIRWNKQFFNPFEKDYKTYYQIRNAGLNLEMKKVITLKNKELREKHFLHLTNKAKDAEVIYNNEKVEEEIIDVNQLILDFEKEKDVEEYTAKKQVENYNSDLKKW
jgi:hypothetical protein